MTSERPIAIESLHILLSAYACEPGRGSEQGVGWRWAVEIARRGHHVTVLTKATNGKPERVAAALSELPPEVAGRLQFEWFDFGPGAGQEIPAQRFPRLRYMVWQWLALGRARRLVAAQAVDLVHHLTWGTVRFSTHLDRLGLPIILGPLGGNENAPWSIRGGFAAKSRVKMALRDIANGLQIRNPFVIANMKRARWVSFRTAESRAAFPASWDDKTSISSDIGAPEVLHEPSPRSAGGVHYLYAGRLIYWKGLDFALRAFSRLDSHVLETARFTIVGKGPDRQRLIALAADLGIADKVDFRGFVPQSQLFEIYREHDVFVFPSLHDSGGSVVLEAMAFGLPVACLKLGGPAVHVGDANGWAVPVDGKTFDGVVTALAQALVEAANPALREPRSAMAREYAYGHQWPRIVEDLYRHVEFSQAKP